MTYPQPQYYPPLQAEAQVWPGVVSVLVTALFAFWVIQQGVKVFRGEEIERPF